MIEKLTRVRLPGQRAFSGLMDWGELTASEMVSMVRRHAQHHREIAEAIEGAADADFQIDVVRGPHVQHHVREVQASSRKEQPA